MKFTHLLVAVVAARALDAQPAISHPRGGYVDVNGARLWYESEGQGEPVILIAGGPGSSHNYFHPNFSQLADSFRIIYFDSYGRGRSDRAPARQALMAYTFERDVRDVEALRRVLGLGRVHVVGHSYGGMVALAYAAAHRDVVRSTTVISTPLTGAAWQEFNVHYNATLRDQYPEAWERVQALRARGLRSSAPEHQEAFGVAPPAMMFVFDVSNGPTLRATQDSLSWNPDVYYSIAGSDADFVLGGSVAHIDLRSVARALGPRLLVLAGRFDREVYPRHTMEYRRVAPRARFVMLEHSGHFPFLEEPGPTFAALRDFLRLSSRPQP